MGAGGSTSKRQTALGRAPGGARYFARQHQPVADGGWWRFHVLRGAYDFAEMPPYRLQFRAHSSIVAEAVTQLRGAINDNHNVIYLHTVREGQPLPAMEIVVSVGDGDRPQQLLWTWRIGAIRRRVPLGGLLAGQFKFEYEVLFGDVTVARKESGVFRRSRAQNVPYTVMFDPDRPHAGAQRQYAAPAGGRPSYYHPHS